MQRFLQFRLGCHSLPVAAGRLAGAAHVDRAHRVCLACNSGGMRCTWFLSVLPLLLYGLGMRACSQVAQTL